MVSWSRQAIQVERWSSTLAGVSFGLILAFVGNRVTESQVPLLLVGAVVFGVIAMVVRWRRPKEIEITTRTPLALRRPQDCQDNARKVYIGFVPLFTPKDARMRADLKAGKLDADIEGLNFDVLNLVDSNLEPTITAIRCHKSRLEHCWLLATESTSGIGSSRYAPLLAEYLRQREGLTCEFHFGPRYTIGLDDDALVFDKTYHKVRDVIRDAKAKKVQVKEMIADISTGVRSMTMGMILACLDGEQDVEVVGSRYGADGAPTGPLFPLIFHFEPEVQDNS